MSDDNVPAVRQPRAALEVATQDTDSWARIMGPLIELSNRIYDTEFVPKGLRGSAPATTAAMLYGREVGLPPMTALNMTHVVEGKPGLSAEGMRALVLAAGHEIEFTETTGATCTMRARRRGGDRWTELSWSIDMARAAGLTGKNNWKNYPRALLQARCTTELCRMVFPDVIHGFRSVEELEDMAEGDTEAADGAPAASSGTKVSRRRTAKKAAAALPTPPVAPPGPPLPGEPGYDEGQEGSSFVATGEDPPASPTDAGEGEDAAVARDTPGEESAPSPAPDGGPEEIPPASGPPPTGEPGEAPPDVATANDPGSPEHEHPTGPRKLSRAQQRMLMAEFSGFGMADDREERLLAATTIVGREVESTNDLTAGEASTLIDTLAKIKDREGLNRLLDEYDAAKAAQVEQDETDEAAAQGES